jgi:hypothetical protein
LLNGGHAKEGEPMRFFITIVMLGVLVLCSCLNVFADNGDFFEGFQPPSGFILDKSQNDGRAFVNLEEKLKLIVSATIYDQDFEKQIQNSSFVSGFRKGQEEAGAIIHPISKIIVLNNIRTLELNGKIKQGNLLVPIRTLTFFKKGHIITISLIGSTDAIKKGANLFTEVESKI